MRIEDILTYLKTEGYEYSFTGNKNVLIHNFSLPENIKKNTIIWLGGNINIKDVTQDIIKTNLIVTNNHELTQHDRLNIIYTIRDRDCFYSIIDKYFSESKFIAGISETTTIKSSNIHETCSIGHNTYIGENVKIGKETIIGNNVVVHNNTIIGENCEIQSGVIIGSDGFGYYKSNEGFYKKIKCFGGVVLEDNVEVGANSCIDRGTFDDTLIGRNTKIGNLCQIGHNVSIGENVIIGTNSSILGSVIVNDNVYIAPQSTIRNKVNLGKNAFIGLGSVVVKNVDENKTVMGVPAK